MSNVRAGSAMMERPEGPPSIPVIKEQVQSLRVAVGEAHKHVYALRSTLFGPYPIAGDGEERLTKTKGESAFLPDLATELSTLFTDICRLNDSLSQLGGMIGDQ